MPILLKAATFQDEVLAAKTPVLVDFYGDHCMPCRLLRPTLMQLSEEYAGKLKICMVNTDQEKDETKDEYTEKFKLIMEYHVMNLPTMLLFADGKLQKTLIGLHTKDELLAELSDFISAPERLSQE